VSGGSGFPPLPRAAFSATFENYEIGDLRKRTAERSGELLLHASSRAENFCLPFASAITVLSTRAGEDSRRRVKTTREGGHVSTSAGSEARRLQARTASLPWFEIYLMPEGGEEGDTHQEGDPNFSNAIKNLRRAGSSSRGLPLGMQKKRL